MLIRVGAFTSGRPPLDAKAEDESGKSGHSETWPGSEQLPTLFLCFDTISTSMNFPDNYICDTISEEATN